MNPNTPPTGPRYADPSGVPPGSLTPRPPVMMVQTRKDVGIAYILWLFLGTLGVHRLYLRQTESGIAMFILNLLGWMTAIFLVGFAFLAIVWIWVIVDLFTIPRMTREANAQVAA